MATFEIQPIATGYQLLIDHQLACTLVSIPKGSFRREDGKIVTVNAFCMARFAVTQDLYEAVTGHNPSSFQGKQHPVEHISWYDAVRFCGILNNELKDYKPLKESGLLKLNNLSDKELDIFNLNPASSGFRLPIEAECEYAAKSNAGNFDPADKVFKYSGSDILDLVGWYSGNNEYETKPVGLKIPNNFGLYDMSGNVWEWCWDWREKNWNYDKYSLNNPVGARSGEYRVDRGGSWFYGAVNCRSDYRGSNSPDDRYDSLGFRLLFVP
jgi:formylglycine-generating enzyme required for sulfatase activity